MKKLAFNLNDQMLLQSLGEYHLYLLNVALIDAASIAKSNWPSRDETYDVVTLAEIAAREVARRNQWFPVQSSGKYSVCGCTYDTPLFRNWLIFCRRNMGSNPSCTDDTVALLEQFSFGNSILAIKRTA